MAALAALGAAAGLAALAPAWDGAGSGGEAHAEPGGGAESGMIVVSDPGNDRIQVFYPDGTFAFKFGTGHVGLGGVRSIDIGPDGRIVAATAYQGIHAFHPNGSYALQIAGHGGAVGLVYQGRVAVAPDGRIVAAEGDRIQVFEPNGSHVSVFEVDRGPDPGEGWHVVDVDVAPDGRIVVADNNWCGNDMLDGRVRFIHPNGMSAFSFATGYRCESLGEIAVGPDGSVVVATAQRGGVEVYRPLPNGTFARHGPNGTVAPNDLNGTVYRPLPNGTFAAVPGIEAVDTYAPRIAVGPDGRIVVKEGDYHLSVFYPNGTRALGFGGHGYVQGGFDRPTDAAVGPDGRIAVAEPGNRTISVFHPNGTLAFSFGSYGHGDDAFYQPHQVAVGPDGRIVVGDTGKHRILVFEPDGTPALAFGSYGGGAGEIIGVRDVAVGPDGSVVVIDGGDYLGVHGRVQVFSPDGSSVFGLDGASHDLPYGYHTAQPRHAAVAPDGRIMVVDSHARLLAFHPNGTKSFIVNFGFEASGVAVGPDGRIVVVGGDRSQVFYPDGTFAFATEIDAQVVSVAVGPNREVVVVDDRDDRVQVFHPNGTFAFGLLPDLSEGKFAWVGSIAVGPVTPRAVRDPAPLTVALESLLPPGPGTAPRNFTALGDDAELLINVTGLAGGLTLDGSESSVVTFPNRTNLVAASFGSVLFPPNVTASNVPADGLLPLRVAADVPLPERVQEALGGNGSEQVIVLVQRVVEVGSGDSRITFDQPIRISLEGQAGGRAFYIDGANGMIIPIDAACPSADDVDAVHAHLGGAGECQADSAGGAKIVWTYHLTKFGTVSDEGPAPQPVPVSAPAPVPVPVPVPDEPPPALGQVNATNGTAGPPPSPPPPPVVVPPGQGGADNSTGGPDAVTPPPPAVQPGQGGADNSTGGESPPPAPPPEPEVVPRPPPAVPAPATCSVALRSPNLSANAQPGGYSQAVRQELINSGTLAFARVELEATPWRDAAAGAPAPAAWPSGPPPAVPAPISGPNVGRAASVLTLNAVVVPSLLPASATEVSEQADGAGGYAALAEGMTVVAGGLEGGGTAPLWFRLNLAGQGGGGLPAGTSLTQSITYQVECAAPPSPPP